MALAVVIQVSLWQGDASVSVRGGVQMSPRQSNAGVSVGEGCWCHCDRDLGVSGRCNEHRSVGWRQSMDSNFLQNLGEQQLPC